jgi:hypothetical protein
MAQTLELKDIDVKPEDLTGMRLVSKYKQHLIDIYKN